jgi:hypothetical protein
MDAEHAWSELPATGSGVEVVVDLPDDQGRTRPGAPIFSNDLDEVLISASAQSEHSAAATFIDARMAEEEISASSPSPESPKSPSQPPRSPPPPPQSPPGGNGRGDEFDNFTASIDRGGNGARQTGGSKTAAAHDTYAEEHAGEPFDDAYLHQQGYKLVRVFDYTLASRAPLYQQNRYELKKGYTPSKKRPRKRFLAHRIVDGRDVLGAGDRRVIYGWPAIMVAGPGSTVFVCEGENKAQALIDAGLLATTALSHAWMPECASALVGRHAIILEDNDDDGRRIASSTQKKLAPVAASTRIVSAAYLWKHLAGAAELRPHDDVVDWIALGGDPKRLLDICREIPIEGALESVCATDVEIEDYEWVWPGRLALKKIGLIVGLPDEGKGLVISDIAARITRGGAPWPCGEGFAPLGSVIILTAEDDISDTIVPRLMAAGADLARVHIVKMMHEAGKERMFSLVTDLPVLRQKIVEVGDVAMVIIDPVSAYLGIGKVDSFRATDVRAMLGPLKVLAEELRVSILGVMHFNKKIDVTNVLLRISDSHAYGAAARHVYGVINDPDNHRRLFVKGKNNLARYEQKTLAFSIDEREVGTDKRTGKPIRRPYVVWHDEPVDITATEALRAVSECKSPSAIDDAKGFLEDLLSNGPVSSTDVQEAAKENGVSRATLRRAKKELDVDIKRDGPIVNNVHTWRWHLPANTETEEQSNTTASG